MTSGNTEKIHHAPFFQNHRFPAEGNGSHHLFFRPAIRIYEAPIHGGSESESPQKQENQGQVLRAGRFENDAILNLVIKNLYTLKKGRTGNAVKKVQRALIDAGFALEKFGPDGIYGDETANAVRLFQEFKGLPAEAQDGKIGPLTMGLLDDHFSDRITRRSFETDPGTDPQFFGIPPMNPRYSNPDPFVQFNGDAIRLNGPTFSFFACVATAAENSSETDRWDIGHVQDVVEGEMSGTYEDGHLRKFISPLPIRDTAPVEQRFPWYNVNFIRKPKNNENVCSPHNDDPGVQFTIMDQGVLLTGIRMKFMAIDWLVARNRNTGAFRFIHHAKWGFEFRVSLDPASLGNPTGGEVISPNSDLPEPVGTNQPIEHAGGMGQKSPVFTEGVFNEEAKLF